MKINKILIHYNLLFIITISPLLFAILSINFSILKQQEKLNEYSKALSESHKKLDSLNTAFQSIYTQQIFDTTTQSPLPILKLDKIEYTQNKSFTSRDLSAKKEASYREMARVITGEYYYSGIRRCLVYADTPLLYIFSSFDANFRISTNANGRLEIHGRGSNAPVINFFYGLFIAHHNYESDKTDLSHKYSFNSGNLSINNDSITIDFHQDYFRNNLKLDLKFKGIISINENKNKYGTIEIKGFLIWPDIKKEHLIHFPVTFIRIPSSQPI